MENNVLVTGADGFIGSHLTEMLVRKGYRVRALAQYNSFNDWGWLEGSDVLEQIDVVTGDVRDPFFCREITKILTASITWQLLLPYRTRIQHRPVTLIRI